MMKILILIIAIFAICNAMDIREDIAEKIKQLSAFRTQMNEAKEAFTRFYEVATHTHNGNMQIIRSIENNKERQERIASPQCLAAYANLTIFLSPNASCYVSLSQYFNTQTSSADKKTAVSNFCTNCQANFVAALKNVINVCNVSDVEQKAIISAGFYPRFLCAQAEGQFCSNVINDVIAQVPANIADLKDDLLVKICSPCVTLALNILQQGNQALAGFDLYFRSALTLRGVCVKLSGKFCFSQLRDNFNTLIQIGAKFNSTNADFSASDFQKILQFFCSPCYRLVSTRLAISNGIPALTALKDFKAVGSLCRKNPAKEFCVVKIFDLAKPIIAAGATGGKLPCDSSFNGSNGTCSDDCKNYIKNFVNKGGCCWSVLLDAITGVGPGGDSNAKQVFIQAIKSCVPDITLPEPCPSVAKATITITYTNIVVSAQIQSAFIQAVLADISVAIGGYDSVNQGGITVTNNKRANSVTVTVPDVQTSGTAGEGLNYSETACNSVCALVPIADPSADVTVSSRTTGYTVQSSSSILTFSFALLFILSLLFF